MQADATRRLTFAGVDRLYSTLSGGISVSAVGRHRGGDSGVVESIRERLEVVDTFEGYKRP